MILWLDEHLSPQLAIWITPTFGFEAVHIRDLGLARAKDREVFDAARQANATILTKDADFVGILERLGPPPRVMADLRQHLERQPETTAPAQSDRGGRRA